MKVWHKGELMTVNKWHVQQTPHEVYHDCELRMGAASPADKARLAKRWPTLGDCNRAMVRAFLAMTKEEQADDLKRVKADLAILAI